MEHYRFDDFLKWAHMVEDLYGEGLSTWNTLHSVKVDYCGYTVAEWDFVSDEGWVMRRIN